MICLKHWVLIALAFAQICMANIATVSRVASSGASNVQVNEYNHDWVYEDAAAAIVSEPGVAQFLDGDIFIAGRNSSNGLVVETFSDSMKTFSGWSAIGGSSGPSAIQGNPSVAITPNGTVVIAVRDTGNVLWVVQYSSPSSYSWTSVVSTN